MDVDIKFGAIAQLGEQVLCKHQVVGSNPSGSTKFRKPLFHYGIGLHKYSHENLYMCVL